MLGWAIWWVLAACGDDAAVDDSGVPVDTAEDSDTSEDSDSSDTSDTSDTSDSSDSSEESDSSDTSDSSEDSDPDPDADGDGFSAAEDCDDADPNVHPGADDPWYDGVDSDCDGADDLDADGDGHADATHASVYTGPLPADDCDDADVDVHPGAEETPYDGIDNDCDPSSPDDDLDADGAGVADDCDDLDPEVHPAAVDLWYDGVDSDCDGADDFDADGDGFASLAHASAYGGDLAATDCADADPDVHPDAVDAPGDLLDDDCSGAPNPGDPSWDARAWRGVVGIDLGENARHLGLAVLASGASTGGPISGATGRLWVFAPDARGHELAQRQWYGDALTDPVSIGPKLLGAGDDFFLAGASTLASPARTRLHLTRLKTNASPNQYVGPVAFADAPATGPARAVDLARDGDRLWVGVVSPGRAQYGSWKRFDHRVAGALLVEDDLGSAPSSLGDALAWAYPLGATSTFDVVSAAGAGEAWRAGAGQLLSATPAWTGDPVTALATEGATRAWAQSDAPGITVVHEGVASSWLETDLDGAPLAFQAVDVATQGDAIAVVGVADGALWFAWGGAGAQQGLAHLPLSRSGAPLGARAAAIWLGADALAVAVVGEDASAAPGAANQAVGWVFFER